MSEFKHIDLQTLPERWTANFLGRIISFRMGKTPPRNQERYWTNGKYPWVSIADMIPFGTVIRTNEQVSEDAHNLVFRKAIVPANSFLMSFKLTVGRVSRLGIPAYHNEAIISFQPNPDKIHPQYLAYHLGQINYRDYQDTAVKGQTLNKGKLEKIEIVTPPLSEQRKIAQVLGLVQRAIEQQERLLSLTIELKRSLRHQLFTRGLRNEPQKQTELGPIPQSWEISTLGSLAKIGNGSTPKRDNKAYWEEGSIPWLNSAKIHERFITKANQFVTDLAVKECHLPRVKPGGLLIAITGQGKTLGSSALVLFETCINQHLAYAQFRTGAIMPEFVLWFLQTRYKHLRSISQAGGSTKGALTCGYLKTYPIPIPRLDEQREIVAVFTALNQKEKLHRRKHASLKALFRTLLHELMTSHIRVANLELLG